MNFRQQTSTSTKLVVRLPEYRYNYLYVILYCNYTQTTDGLGRNMGEKASGGEHQYRHYGMNINKNESGGPSIETVCRLVEVGLWSLRTKVHP